jgi:hypothetical protein
VTFLAKSLFLLARQKRFELLTPRFVVYRCPLILNGDSANRGQNGPRWVNGLPRILQTIRSMLGQHLPVPPIGIARARLKIGMMNLGYNIRRLVQIERAAAAPARVGAWAESVVRRANHPCRGMQGIKKAPTEPHPARLHTKNYYCSRCP